MLHDFQDIYQTCKKSLDGWQKNAIPQETRDLFGVPFRLIRTEKAENGVALVWRGSQNVQGLSEAVVWGDTGAVEGYRIVEYIDHLWGKGATWDGERLKYEVSPRPLGRG